MHARKVQINFVLNYSSEAYHSYRTVVEISSTQVR